MRGGDSVLASPAPLDDLLPPEEEVATVVATENKDAAKRPEIGSKAVALVVAPDLGGHVGRRPRHLGSVEAALSILREQGRQAKVGQFPVETPAPLTHPENVVRLEVPMEDRLGPEVVEVAQCEGKVPEASPDAVLLEAHGVRLQRLGLHEVGKGSPVRVLHDDAQLPLPVLQEETPQPDDVLAVQLHQGDHLLHRLLVVVLYPLHRARHPSNLLLEDAPESTLPEKAHAWAADYSQMSKSQK